MCINAYNAYINVYNTYNVHYIEYKLHIINEEEDLEKSALMPYHKTTLLKKFDNVMQK